MPERIRVLGPIPAIVEGTHSRLAAVRFRISLVRGQLLRGTIQLSEASAERIGRAALALHRIGSLEAMRSFFAANFTRALSEFPITSALLVGDASHSAWLSQAPDRRRLLATADLGENGERGQPSASLSGWVRFVACLPWPLT